MPEVEQLLPTPGRVGAAALVDGLRAAQEGTTPFHPDVLAFAADLARRLRRHRAARHQPALGALAFWIRRANLERLRAGWVAAGRTDQVRVPRGVVFHLPPTNVDTLFVYSWLLSALVGNANVVRLSPNARGAAAPLLGVLGDALAEHPRVAACTAVVTYGHEAETTAALSHADVRVIWGGDDTVAAIRAVPLPPHASELAFPDRSSLAAFDAVTVLALADEALAALAQRFYDDAYWFDQLGCASPRIVVWRGAPDDADAAAGRLFGALAEVVASKGYEVPTGAVVAKLVHAADVATHGVLAGIDRASNTLTVGYLRGIGELPRDSPGGGLFYAVRVDELRDLVPVVRRRDQTLAVHGFSDDELRELALALNGRGVDRIVAVGDALAFDHVWDGWDLLSAFSRLVALPSPNGLRLAATAPDGG